MPKRKGPQRQSFAEMTAAMKANSEAQAASGTEMRKVQGTCDGKKLFFEGGAVNLNSLNGAAPATPIRGAVIVWLSVATGEVVKVQGSAAEDDAAVLSKQKKRKRERRERRQGA